MLKILIVDDHAVVRNGLRQILLKEYPSADIEEAENAEAAIKKISGGGYDIVISDLTMPGRSGLELLQYIKKNYPAIPVLILSIHPEELYAIRTLKAGASGYISKDAASQELIQAVQRLLQGRRYISTVIAEKIAEDLDKNPTDKPPHELLSDREFEIFKLLAAGMAVSEIAEKYSISISTVSTYRARILLKMGMKSNADLTRYAISMGLV
jgi:two-component system invasion response regulator UvrY